MDNWYLIKIVKKGLKEKKLFLYVLGIFLIVYLNNKKKKIELYVWLVKCK